MGKEESDNKKFHSSIWIPSLCMSVLYVIYFIAVSEEFMHEYDNFFTIYIIIMGITILVILYGTDKIHSWFLADIIYCIWIWLYDAHGAYGIGVRRGLFSWDAEPDYYSREQFWDDLVFTFFLFFLSHSLICGITKLVKHFIHKKKENR